MQLVTPEYFDAVIPFITEIQKETNGFIRLKIHTHNDFKMDWKQHGKGGIRFVTGFWGYSTFESKEPCEFFCEVIIENLQLAEYILSKFNLQSQPQKLLK